jgi:hypothetical protein
MATISQESKSTNKIADHPDQKSFLSIKLEYIKVVRHQA